MYITDEQRNHDSADCPVQCYELHGIPTAVIDESILAESPELLELLTVDVPGMQHLAGVDGFFKKLKRGIKRISRKVKKVVKKVGKVTKKVVMAHVNVATLGVTKYHQKVTQKTRDIRRLQKALGATSDPRRRALLIAQINAAKARRGHYKSRRKRGLQLGAAVGAAVVGGPALIGVLGKGAAAAKSFLGPLLAGRGMPPGIVNETVGALLRHPPDPRLKDPEAMVADSMTKQGLSVADLIGLVVSSRQRTPTFAPPPMVTPYAPPPPSWAFEPEEPPPGPPPEKPASGFVKALPWVAAAAAVATALK